jgi:hypothetical protein
MRLVLAQILAQTRQTSARASLDFSIVAAKNAQSDAIYRSDESATWRSDVDQSRHPNPEKEMSERPRPCKKS